MSVITEFPVQGIPNIQRPSIRVALDEHQDYERGKLYVIRHGNTTYHGCKIPYYHQNDKAATFIYKYKVIEDDTADIEIQRVKDIAR